MGGTDPIAPAITGAAMRAEAMDEKRLSIAAAGAGEPRNSLAAENAHLENFPTAEEMATLRRVPNKIPIKLLSIAFVEMCERFSFYGCTAVFTNFIQQPLPDGSNTGANIEQPGALGMGQRASTGITTFNQFWNYSMPLLGAYMADQFWGRYWTITGALGVDIFGHIILILAAIPPIIVNPDASLALLIVAILFIGLGTGGFKSNISVLIVEQLGDQHMFVKTLKSGERVIVDPAITTERIYLWFYFSINTGALIGQLGMAYAAQRVGYYLAFTLPAIMLCLCPAVMLWGRKRYVRREPSGSVLGPAMRLFLYAQRGRWSINPFKTWRNMHDGTFWESVMPSRFSNETRPAWMANFDDAFVEEVRRGLNACAVFCYLPIFWLCYNQTNNNLISQAAVLERHGVPNDVISNLNPFALLIFIPLNDFFIYPAMRKAGIRITPIKKIAAGFFVGCAAMIWAAVLQYYVYEFSVCGERAAGEWVNPETGEQETCPEAPINVWAQSGAYILIALSEVCSSITSLEYAYTKAPKSMRSMVQAVALFMTAFAAALGQALVGLSSDPLLVWLYTVVACLAFVAGCLFYWQFKSLDDIEDSLNALPEGVFINKKTDPEASKAVMHEDRGESIDSGRVTTAPVAPAASRTPAVPAAVPEEKKV